MDTEKEQKTICRNSPTSKHYFVIKMKDAIKTVYECCYCKEIKKLFF